jgi:transposase
MTRLYGRVIGGKRLFDPIPHGHWCRTTVISAIRIDGTTISMSIEGSTNTEVFKAYISEMLCKALHAGDIVIMDNLTSHKVSGIEESIKAVNAEVRYLPPYSPDLNPIEKMWSKIKAILRKLKARTEDGLFKALAEALNSVTKSDAVGWFESCGYLYAKT